MKISLDEKVKHRIVGVAVIFSVLAAIFPFLLQNNNQEFDEPVHVSLQLPPQPDIPEIASPKTSELFVTEKVAHVELPSVPDVTSEDIRVAAVMVNPLSKVIVKTPEVMVQSTSIAHLSKVRVNKKPGVMSASIKSTVMRPVVVPKSAHAEPRVMIRSKSIPTSKPIVAAHVLLQKRLPAPPIKGGFAVQVASLSQKANAEALMSQLRAKGYQVLMLTKTLANGVNYKVLVGSEVQREGASRLQKQLADKMKINGFIVTKGVS